ASSDASGHAAGDFGAAFSSPCRSPASIRFGRSRPNRSSALVVRGRWGHELRTAAYDPSVALWARHLPRRREKVMKSRLHHHLDQARAVGLGERLLERGFETRSAVDALGGDAEALGQRAGVDGGILEVHADRLVVAVEELQPVLEDLVAAIVQ